MRSSQTVEENTGICTIMNIFYAQIKYINNTILVISLKLVLKHENLQEIVSRLLKAPTATQIFS